MNEPGASEFKESVEMQVETDTTSASKGFLKRMGEQARGIVHRQELPLATLAGIGVYSQAEGLPWWAQASSAAAVAAGELLRRNSPTPESPEVVTDESTGIDKIKSAIDPDKLAVKGTTLGIDVAAASALPQPLGAAVGAIAAGAELAGVPEKVIEKIATMKFLPRRLEAMKKSRKSHEQLV